MKSTHSDSASADPVAKGKTGNAKNRPLDKETGDKEADLSVVKSQPAVTVFPSGKISEEEIKGLFDGVDGLSEEFGNKAAVIFEGAVSARVEEIREALEADYQTKLVEASETAQADLVEHLDTYLDMVVEEYLTQNALQIEEGIKSEFSEQVMQSVAAIVESYGVSIPEDKVDVAAELASTVTELESSLNESLNENVELAKQLKKYQVAEAFAEVTEGLDDASVDTLKKLTENISYDSIDTYKSKVEIFKEHIGKKSGDAKAPAATAEKPTLTEEVNIHQPTADKLSEQQKTMREIARAMASGY